MVTTAIITSKKTTSVIWILRYGSKPAAQKPAKCEETMKNIFKDLFCVSISGIQ